ncbi:MAG: phosphatase PAP2 family protein [Gammaproteobacteria bacterium]
MAMRFFAIMAVGALLTSGCTTTTSRGYWGQGIAWPNGGRLGQAAVSAAKDPQTWVPLAGAAVIGIGGWDNDISDWAVDNTPIFGNNADDASDTLRTISTGAWVVTGLLTPADSLESRAKGFLVQGSALAIEQGTVQGLKSLIGRERPNGADSKSMPSGHASSSSVSAGLAATNLAYIDMPGWTRTTMQIGLYGTAAATGWARVEAAKHYPTDVLVGYAIGQFVARFMHDAFFNDQHSDGMDTAVVFRPLPGGGALTVAVPLP